MTKALRDSYVIELVPLADSVPENVRLKRLLKMMLRGYRFRCRMVRRVEADQKTAVHRGEKQNA